MTPADRLKIWDEVRAHILQVLQTHAPHLDFETRVIIAEDAARDTQRSVRFHETD